MRKLKAGDRIVFIHEDRRVGGALRRVGCDDPDCPSCEGHWKQEAPPRGFDSKPLRNGLILRQ
jgi:hypothetical protein